MMSWCAQLREGVAQWAANAEVSTSGLAAAMQFQSAIQHDPHVLLWNAAYAVEVRNRIRLAHIHCAITCLGGGREGG